jgi:hypothetical protein
MAREPITDELARSMLAIHALQDAFWSYRGGVG